MPLATIAICLITVAIVMWFSSKASFTAYLVGVALGTALALLALRKIGSKSQKSLLWASIFHWLTKYRARNYTIQRPRENISIKLYGEGHDYADLFEVLKNQLHFPASRAKEAAKYATDNASGKPMQDKIIEALKYLDESKTVSNGS
jgi:hypothetical protein